VKWWYSLLLNFYVFILVPYFLKLGNELCTDTEVIETLEECKVAIRLLDLKFAGTEMNEHFKKGCYLLKGQKLSYWNTPKSEKKSYRRGQPICKKGEEIE
jgi:hypothetical protein